VQKHALPGVIPIPGNADQRERIRFAEQAVEQHAPAHGGRGKAVFHVAQRLEQRAAKNARRRLPDGGVAIRRDDIVRRQGWRESRAALAEHLEKQPEAAPRPIQFPLHQGDIDQDPVERRTPPNPSQVFEAALDLAIDRRQPLVRAASRWFAA